ncbi:putative exonuclease of the beta-lactamase fold involved in RNA processing [Thermanaerovibrio velox DSM 12556]|uniref:Putative exonuclease of the beta-lactamase fold involved in RNA processing n=1 Tax=Thermanaerovibrio velox DSM 12556 TaxID=926567 RepID=H0UQ96_9BACT|nr:MBL fold metallo-hydrolase [Thermanaerovibrio velox]EHM10734.1 putative exonuclease of the beta-lactamase fold involved in RNA processing [Thermanaerovibrio velox DSM 12556]
MNLKFLGAAGEVTGSCYLLETDDYRVLVDCGIHQGKDDEDLSKSSKGGYFPFNPANIDAVLLTHAHMDHSGLIPLLSKQGFKGPVFATSATVEFCDVLWRDSAHLMREEAEWRTRKNIRKGLPPVEPLYDDDDVDRAVRLLRPVSYDEVMHLDAGFQVRFRDAGHILGSAMIEVWLGPSRDVKLVFSGDLGPMKTVMEKSPSIIEDADFVVIESTYGDRLHKDNESTREEFRAIISEALSARGKVLIPTFVVDRAQRVLYELNLFQRAYPQANSVPIFFDSPMGMRATDIYRAHPEMLSQELQAMIRGGDDPFSPRNLRHVASVDDSRSINQMSHAVVMAGSGMCTGGRIVHHLKNNLWQPSCHVIIVGYQAKGTLGRRLVEGEKVLKIAGEEVSVQAKIHTVNGFSAHGDKRDLLTWAGHFESGPLFIVTHGEPKSSEALARSLGEMGYRAIVPRRGEEINLRKADVEVVPEVMPLVPFQRSRRDEVLEALAEIASLSVGLRDKLSEGEVPKDAIPLIESSRTLLKTVERMR